MGNLDPHDRAVLKVDEFGRHYQQGHTHAAIAAAQDAYETVLDTDDERLIGWAVANLGSAYVLAGRGQEAISTLAKWLTTSTDPYVSYRLSQNLAAHHRFQRAPDWVSHHKHHSIQSYDHAERSGVFSARACASHELGIVSMAESDFMAARELFNDSLRLLGKQTSPKLAPYLASLGVSLCRGADVSGGLRAFSHSIGIARAAEAPHYELYPRVFVADSLLEMRRPRDAEFHLRIALQLDRFVSVGQPDTPRTILHLLGDALKMQRRAREAFDVFQHLQTNFYPDQEGLAEILMEVDARRRIDVF